MTAPELKRYAPIETPDGLFGNVDMMESPHGEHVRFADVEAYTQAAIAVAMMWAVKPLETPCRPHPAVVAQSVTADGEASAHNG